MPKNSWLPASPLEWISEALSLLAVLFCIGFPLLHWPELPDRIPTHFNLRGEADGWGSKDSIWLLTGAALVCYVLLSFASRKPQFINVPMELDRTQPAVQAVLQTMIVTLKPLVLAMFPYMLWQSLTIALGHAASSVSLLLPLWLTAIAAHMAFFLLRLRSLS